MGLPHLYKGDTGPKPRPAKAPGRRRGRAGPAGHQQSPRARGCRQSAPPPTSAWGRLVAFGFCSNKLSPLLNMPQFTSKPSCCQRRDPKETPPPSSPQQRRGVGTCAPRCPGLRGGGSPSRTRVQLPAPPRGAFGFIPARLLTTHWVRKRRVELGPA